MTAVFAINAFASAVAAPVVFAIRSATRACGLAWTVMSNRWVAKQLNDLTDYELADIGLTRDDLYGAFTVSHRSDITLRLAAVAQERIVSNPVPSIRVIAEQPFPDQVRGRRE